jgi:hypothetical protein
MESSVTAAVAAVKKLDHDLETFEAQWLEALDTLIPFIATETIDPMVAAMSENLRDAFYSAARLQFMAFDEIIAGRLAEGRDPTGWIALREWLYRQPFDVDPSLPPPTRDEAKRIGTSKTLQRILPHLRTQSVEAILDQLPPKWRRGRLRGLVAGMRPGLETILATCRAHGQDEEPWHILMAWEAGLPKD